MFKTDTFEFDFGGDADDRPTEEVAFYYNKISFDDPDPRKIEWTYEPEPDNSAGDPLPSETITLNYTEVEWTY